MRGILARYKQMFAVGWMLARRTLLAEVRTSRLGWLWPVIYPIAYTALFLSLKPIMHRADRSAIQYGLYMFVGLSLWQLWFEGLQTQMAAVKSQRALLSRADLDPGALFLSDFLVQAVYLVPRLALALLFAAILGPLGSPLAAVAFVLSSLLVVLNGSVIGFVLQPYATLLPDIRRVVQSISLALMVTGGIFVVIPPDIGERTLALLSLNPLGPLVDAARAALLGEAARFGWARWAWGGLTLVALAVQVRLARKVLPVLLERVGG